MPNSETQLNIHQKLLKIADMAGILQKNRQGFNYKYTTEDEIQAKITAGMQKHKVMLYPSIMPGTLEVLPHTYQKPKTRKIKVKDDSGKLVEKNEDYLVPVNEIIVKAEVQYTWVNAENPEEKIVCGWAYIGQMEDASQAFGAGATYGNRYYLLKALQLATTEDDPDNYRSKQKKAESYEEEKAAMELAEAIKEIVEMGKVKIKMGIEADVIRGVVARHNEGNENPSSIKDLEICKKVLEELTALKAPKTSSKGEQK